MANIIPNIAKGRWAELYDRVKAGDPAACRLYVIPISAGAVTDAQLLDADDFGAMVTLGVTERTANGWNRKTLAAADLTVGAPDDTNDRNDRSLPTAIWTAVSVDAVTDLVICYASVATPTNAQLVPIEVMDFAITPSGSDVQMTTNVFGRAA